MTETDVVTKFAFILAKNDKIDGVLFEQPRGAWSGKKKRNRGDITPPNSSGFGPFEAKSNFNDAKKDFLNSNKNNGILNYLYYEKDADRFMKQESFWRSAGVHNVLVFAGNPQTLICLVGNKHALNELLGEQCEVFGE